MNLQIEAEPIAEAERGRDAEAPRDIPLDGWLDIAARVWTRLIDDRVGLAAAGVSFYGILALFPAMAAFVSLYGIATDPVTIADHVDLLIGIVPPGGLDLFRTELERITGVQTDTLGLSLVVSFGFSLWVANNGMRAMFQAMNLAYDETEKRTFLHLLGVSLALTVSVIVITILVLNVVVVLPIVLSFVGIDGWAGALSAAAPFLLLFLVVNLGIAALYRFGPSRRAANWRWITWGSALASVLWVAISAAFAFYLGNWGNYTATYGSLGTVIGLMMWMYISTYVVIVGAELNAETEHQTLVDSTVGPDRPIGQRGAHVADTVGRARKATGDGA